MEQEYLQIHEQDLEVKLLARLKGRVFHVTTHEAFSLILASNAILSNQDGSLGYTFGQSKDSYFRKIGCVSLIDIRVATSDQVKGALYPYYFLNPSFTNDRPVFFLLQESRLPPLVSWEACERGAMVVPYVEAGHCGAIPLSIIDRVLIVEVVNTPKPTDKFDEIVERGRSTKARRKRTNRE